MKTSILKFLLVFGILGIYHSCTKDCTHPIFEGDDDAIVSFSFSNADGDHLVKITSDSLLIHVDYGFDFSSVTPNVVLSEAAEISPALTEITDWSAAHEFTVSSANGQTTKKYAYKAYVAEYQKVYDKVAHLTSQAEVDEFGANEYTHVGGIIIDGSADSPITNLESLSSIIEIQHNFKVANYQGLNLRLENLQKITTFNIKSDSLKTLELPKLKVATNFFVGFLNDEYSVLASKIETVSCPSLTTVINDFAVAGYFVDLTGFSNLEEVGGEIIVGGRLVSLKGFEKITYANYITISASDLTSLDGIQNLTTVKNAFELMNAQKLENLDGLNLQEAGNIAISNCIKLRNIDPLETITELDILYLANVHLTDLKGLRNLKTIKKDLILTRLYYQEYDYSTIPYTITEGGVKNLNDLSNLETIGRHISIDNCIKLTDFSGLSKVAAYLNANSFTGTWKVEWNAYNPTLEEFLAGKYTADTE
ncbi:MAG: hypothetical protein ACK5IJ_11575 [Mangrovibacterium sp.]